jgi:hypothetical protein
MGEDISYPMVGVHDYILVNPKNINTYLHGFDLYKSKIYPRIFVQNDYKNEVAQLQKRGYQNFYFVCNKPVKKDFLKFVNRLKHSDSHIKILVSAKNKDLNKLSSFVDGVVVYGGVHYTRKEIETLTKEYATVIDIEFTYIDELQHQQDKVQQIQDLGMIPYITNSEMNAYGLGTKKVVKREVLTIIDEDKIDRILSSAHQYGAMPLEYMGYIQDIHNVTDPLADVDYVATRYAGVVVWLSTDIKEFDQLYTWVLELIQKGVKVSFAANFGFIADGLLLNQLGIQTSDGDPSVKNKKHITHRDAMMGYEIEPQINDSTLYLHPMHPKKPLLTYEDEKGANSTPAAIMPWGGYAVFGSFLFEYGDNNLWIIDPFAYFKQSLDLKTLPVPDVTTHNGRRIFFTHIDGDGIMNAFETDPQRYLEI